MPKDSREDGPLRIDLGKLPDRCRIALREPSRTGSLMVATALYARVPRCWHNTSLLSNWFVPADLQ